LGKKSVSFNIERWHNEHTHPFNHPPFPPNTTSSLTSEDSYRAEYA